MMNGLVHHNSHEKDDNSVTMAMQRITLMAPRYADRIWLLNTVYTGHCTSGTVRINIIVFYRR